MLRSLFSKHTMASRVIFASKSAHGFVSSAALKPQCKRAHQRQQSNMAVVVAVAAVSRAKLAKVFAS